MTFVPTSNPDNFSDETPYSSCAYSDPTIFTVIPVYIMVISVMGIIMNVFVLLVFCLHKKPCTVAEIYLSNLAAADLLLTSFLPIWARNVAEHYNWPFTGFLCKAFNAAIVMNVFSSIYFIVLISIDRYLALVHPLSHERMRRPCSAKLGCVMVWGLSLVLASPTIIYRKLEHNSYTNATLCVFKIPHYDEYNVTMAILTFIIPISLTSFFTVKILKTFKKRSLANISSSPQIQEQKATTLVLAVFLAFLTCWLPFHIIKIVSDFYLHFNLTGCRFLINLSLCRNIFVYLAYFNSVLNPILYVIVGTNFQKKAKELFKIPCNKERPVIFSLVSLRLSRSGHTDQASC